LKAESTTRQESDTSDPPAFEVGDEVVIVDGGCASKTKGDTAIVNWVDSSGCHLDNSFYYLFKRLRHAKYQPAVGDVVEFEFSGRPQQGIVFAPTVNRKLSVTHARLGGSNFTYCRIDYEAFGEMKKVGHTDEMGGIDTYEKANPIAKVYFSAPDKDAPYTERQAHWCKANSIKVGSPVKVVRKFENQEDGFGHGWISSMDRNIDEVIEVKCITDNYIDLGYGFPYFVLEPVTS
jgi:hypothetical protein